MTTRKISNKGISSGATRRVRAAQGNLEWLISNVELSEKDRNVLQKAWNLLLNLS
jgi:hypothetical protein